MFVNLFTASRYRMILLTLCVWGTCSGPSVAHEESATDATAPLPERLHALIAALEQYGIAFDSEQAYKTVMDALIMAADPQGGVYTDAAEQSLARQRAGTVYEPGIRLGITNEYVRLVQIEDEMPAGKTDLAVGDTLLKINQTDVTASGLHRIQRLLRCESVEPVALTVQTADGAVITQHVERAETTLPDMEAGEALPFDLAYLRVNRLHPGTGAAIAEAITRWADEKRYGIVLDLRGADGDDLDSVKAVAELFAQPGSPLFTYRDKDDQDMLVNNAGDAGPLTMPVMALIDADTGGAAEVLAAVLSDSVRGAMLFGQPTRGDMLIRDIVELPDATRLYLATRRLITADGTTYVGIKGVRPDVIVARADEDTTVYKPVRSSRTEVLDEEIEQEKLYHRARGDATLRRAIDVLLGLKALDIRPRATPSY